MRIKIKEKEILKVIHKDRIQYVIIKNYNLLDKRYIKMVLKPTLEDLKSNYILIYANNIMCFENKGALINEISNPFKYKLDTKTIKEILR